MKNSIKTYSTHDQLRNFIFQLIITSFEESILLTFTDNDKFDSMNWIAWSRLIHVTTKVRGVFGYFYSSIKNPAVFATITALSTGKATFISTTMLQPSTTSTTLVPLFLNDISWDFLTPSPAE